MWNREIDFEAEREGQEFQAKSGVARVVASYSSSKLSKSKYHLANSNEINYTSKDFISYSKIRRAAEDSATQIIPIIFAVFINLLDACTFGTVFFPSKLGSNISGLAIELFLLSTVVVQLVLIKMSSFSCGLGTSMAENIPFVHTMASGIFDSLEHTHSVQQMLPTVLVTVCLSTIINGILFFVVGYFKMGNILHFFPRHVIMGMTAGFGVFLMSTAVESSTGIVMAEQDLVSFVRALTPSRMYQLLIVFSFEMLLRLTEYLKCNELVVPCMMFFLPIAFYIVLAASGTSFSKARRNDWLFPETASAKWWDTWLLFDFSMVVWEAVAYQWTTIFSLAFFTLILVPIRIPSLSMITEDDVNFDEELKAQGIANILAGLSGAVHNYLSYSNSIFFFFVGGRGKGSQLAVTVLTLLLFFVGPQIINYVPRLIAGVIMLHLGVDLAIGSLISSRKALDSLEYTSVVFIATVVSFLGFVPGICMGVVSACVTFVVQSSRQSSIRAVFSGDTARSNTSWSARQRDKLDVGLLSGSSIIVVQLQGHLFFGNVQQVVEGIENALAVNLSAESGAANTTAAIDSPLRDPNPNSQLRYLILDCSFVTGADVNAVTGLLKMRDAIASKYNQILSDCESSSGEGPGPIQVRVIFAGLQANLEVMFSIQENALAEQQANKAAKEREKAGVSAIRFPAEGDLSPHCRTLSRMSEAGSERTMRRDYSDNRLTDFLCDEIALRIYETTPGPTPTATSEKALTHIKTELSKSDDMSGYNSAQTFDSYSSEEDTKRDSSAFSPGLRAEQKAGELDDVIAMRKKKGRSPSWGSSSLSKACLVVRGHSACSNSSDGSVNKPQPRLSAKSQKSEVTRRVTPVIIAPPLRAPVPVRLSPVKRMFDVEGLSKAKSESELFNVVGDLSTHNPTHNDTGSDPSPDPTFRTSANYVSPRPLSRMFYSDVNTALQAVEERIIKSTPMPKKRVSSFYVRRSILGNTALQHSMSAELRREDIVHSPEAYGSSLDDNWLKRHKAPKSFSPPPPLSLCSQPSSSGWAVGPQVYSMENTGSEKSPLLGHTGSIGQSLKFSEYMSVVGTATSRINRSRHGSETRLSTHQEVEIATDTDVEKEGTPSETKSEEYSQAMIPLMLTQPEEGMLRALTKMSPDKEKERGRDVLAIDTRRSFDYGHPPQSLQELVISSPVPRHVPSSPLSPNSRQLKLKITNMLFDLSSQWTLGDSSTLKRLARRLRKGVLCVRKREVLWEAGQDAMQMGILLSGRLKAVLRSNSEAATETTRTLQVILPGTIFGELGLLSRGTHSRTIIASTDSRLAMLSRDNLDEIEETDKPLLCVLQHLALRTAAGRSHELMLFSAGSLGP